jgi:hypothetical protein
LPANHPLKTRTLRDHLEHFDERLDHWAANSKRRNYVQDLIGGDSAISGVDPEDIMRWYNPATGRVRFRGEEYDLRELADAVADVLDHCMAALPELFRNTSFAEILRTTGQAPPAS